MCLWKGVARRSHDSDATKQYSSHLATITSMPVWLVEIENLN